MIFTVMVKAGTSMISASHHSKNSGNFASLKYKLELTATIADTIISETLTPKENKMKDNNESHEEKMARIKAESIAWRRRMNAPRSRRNRKARIGQADYEHEDKIARMG